MSNSPATEADERAASNWDYCSSLQRYALTPNGAARVLGAIREERTRRRQGRIGYLGLLVALVSALVSFVLALNK